MTHCAVALLASSLFGPIGGSKQWEGKSRQVPWEPMSTDQAQKVVDAMPRSGTVSAEQWARYAEAWLVAAGVPPKRIKADVEAILGHPVD